MGQAKNRGSFEQRKSAAIARNKLLQTRRIKSANDLEELMTRDNMTARRKLTVHRHYDFMSALFGPKF